MMKIGTARYKTPLVWMPGMYDQIESGFIGKTGDWFIKRVDNYINKAAALRREKQIKARKSRKMIEKLIREI